MDFSTGLGLSFGENDQEEEFNNGGVGQSSDNNDQDEQMEDNGEPLGDPMSFESQLEDPDSTPRASSSNQFTSNNPTSFGAPVQSFSQPYRQAQPGAPFSLSANDEEFQPQMTANFGSRPNPFYSQTSSGQSYTTDFARGVQGLQSGRDSQFNGHGHPQTGFQNTSQPDSDNHNAFGNSGMHSGKHFNTNKQNHMSVQAMQQSNITGESQNLNAFHMTGYSSSNNNQTFGVQQMNPHEFNQQTPRMNPSFHPRPGSSMNSQFQRMSNTTHQMHGNQFGNQEFDSSFTPQGEMNQMHHSSQMPANSNIKNEHDRSGFPFQSTKSKQGHSKVNNANILPKPAHNPNPSISQQNAIQKQMNMNNWINRKMLEMGLNPRNPLEVRTFKERCMLQKAEIDRRKAEAERARSSSTAGPSRVSSSSTVAHHPMDRNEGTQQGMGQGQHWPNQFGQGYPLHPFHPQGNATSGPQMNPGPSQPAFPPVPAHLVLGSNNNPREPVFGQDFRDYTQLNMNAPMPADPRPYQLRQQLRPPTLQQNDGGRAQQGHQFNHPQPLHPGGSAQVNQFGPPQQFHHHGLPPEYIPPPGHHPNNLADNGVPSADPIEEDEDEQQQEEVSEPELQQVAEEEEEEEEEEGEESEEESEEEEEAEEAEAEAEEEVDSDGFSIHSDQIGSPLPNVYPIPRPVGIPPSPIPRFPSNEVNPNNALNRPPPVIGSGYKVWSIAPNAFNAKGNITDWNKARRRKVNDADDCTCGGKIHRNGKGYYVGADQMEIWCNGGHVDDGGEKSGDNGNGESSGQGSGSGGGGGGGGGDGDGGGGGDEDTDGDADGEESEEEEDEALKGVPAWVKQVLTHGPRIDQNEVRREEEAYRTMMAEKVKNILARKAAIERGEEFPEATLEDIMQGILRENDFAEGQEEFDLSTFFDTDEASAANAEHQPELEAQGKGKRKASALDSDSDNSEVGSPVKKWKGKGKAVDSDEELDERELARKYSEKSKGKGKSKDKGKGKGKGTAFQLPENDGEQDALLFGNPMDIDHGGADDIFRDSTTAGDDESDTDLAASGIVLPSSFPLPPDSTDEEGIEEIARQAPYLGRRNEGPFNIFQSLLLTPEIILELMLHLSPKQLLALYCMSRPFNETLSGWMAHAIKNIVKHQAPYSYKIYPFVLYRELSVLDPLGHLNQSGQVRRLPGLKYHQMVLHRVRATRDILAALARKQLRCPPGTNHSLKKVWFLMDISTTLDRVRLMHNRAFFTDRDLYNIQHFIVKLDMRLNDPMDGPGSDFLRKLMLGQRGLSPLWRLLTRTGFTDLCELQRYMVRYAYDPLVAADDVGEGLFGVPLEEIGRAHLEGWGKGEKHLMRIDELVMREAVRRELGLKEHIAMMLLWGYVDPVTGENLKPSDQECYMSDGEGGEVPAEGDPWEGSGMNMVDLEAEVLGKEESDGEEEGGEWEDEDEDEDEQLDEGPGEGPSNSRALWTA
ncbi:hypothetical protein EYC84_005083 [Monilinia fructicola]|uniref:F-box domain-containing protein n=1 Tax=Monilinia fructicola TaxID=38448 RepID=A0A5M9JVF9_MONFR|nr:hypothetical protein EYC84_005083 [Monilinia fructicola]